MVREVAWLFLGGGPVRRFRKSPEEVLGQARAAVYCSERSRSSLLIDQEGVESALPAHDVGSRVGERLRGGHV